MRIGGEGEERGCPVGTEEGSFEQELWGGTGHAEYAHPRKWLD